MINIAGVWKGKTRDGKEYLSLSLNSRVMIFKNDNEEGSKKPAYSVVVVDDRKKDDKPKPNKPEVKPEYTTDEIPF